jgi:hypothetical protein
MKSEYEYLLDFFIQVAAFEAVTSTFTEVTKEEKDEINSVVTMVKSELSEILPRVQNREANLEAGRISRFNSGIKESRTNMESETRKLRNIRLERNE